MDDILLDVKGLRTWYHTLFGTIKAVDEVDLLIKKRKVVGIVGESGCGKSTLGLSLMRLVPYPGEILGSITYRGTNLLELTEKEMRRIRGKEISMAFQDPMTYLNPVMKVGNQIVEALNVHGSMDRRRTKEMAIDALRNVRIASPEETYSYYPHQLSGGMRQRVLVAIAIALDPKLLIADEPTTALDVTIQRQILELFKKLVADRGFSVIIITHDLGIIAELCDEVYVMYCGRMLEQSDTYSLFENASHPYTRALLKSAMSIDEYKEELETIEGDVPNLLNPPPGCKFHPRCPYAKEVCKSKEPQLITVASGHQAACWLLEEAV